MQRLTFTNSRGASFVFQSVAPWVFWKINGLEIPPVAVIGSQAAGQRGYTLENTLFDERVIRLVGHIHGNGALTREENVRRMYELRKRLNDVLNPSLGPGLLLYENDAGGYAVTAFCKTVVYGDKYFEFQTLDIMFECPDPLFRSPEAIETRLAYSEGTLTWPLITPGLLGMNEYSVVIDNNGSEPSPFEMWIDGGAVDPVVTNMTTGEFIGVSRFFGVHTQLYINTDTERLEVSLISTDPVTNAETRENAYNYLADGSTLFKLAVGENRLTYHSSDNSLTTRIKIKYYKLFAGV